MIECPIFEQLDLDWRKRPMPNAIFDELLNELTAYVNSEPWDLEPDYELPALPIHMAIEQTRRRISSSFDTQLMEVIS